MKKRILVAMAHANDMEFYAGGTIAKFVREGFEVVLVMFTANISGADIQGDGNYLNHLPEDVVPVRRDEMHRGAAELGVKDIVEMGYKDSLYYTGQSVAWMGESDYDDDHPSGGKPLPAAAAGLKAIEKMRKLLEQYEPEIVITHNFSSGFEHTCVAHIVNQAFGEAVKAGVSLGSLWIPAHVRHGAWASDVRLHPSPNIIIDVTDHWSDKLRAMRAHRSQNIEKAVKKVDLIARYWGIVRQCRYAEPFFTVYEARYR